MTLLVRLTALACAPLAMILAATSLTATSGSPAHAGPSASGATCEIKVSKRGGMTTLEGFVVSPTAISGSYRVSVTSAGGGGGSDIDQSGAFSAKAGQSTSLGVVSMGGSAGSYNAELTVKWNGGSTRCQERVNGRI